MIVPQVSIALPSYNESKQLPFTVKKIDQALKKLKISYEIVIADDGSTDDTPTLIKSLKKKYPHMRYVRNEKNMGRGEAVSRAFLSSKAEILIFMDCDLSTDLKYLPQLIQSIKDGADVATGSRWVEGAHVDRDLFRLVISFVYNNIVRILFKSKVMDHQCGFKAFRRKAALELISGAGIRSDRSWAWDAEILIRAQRKKMRIVEFPVVWTKSLKTTTRFFRDGMVVWPYLIKLRLRLWGLLKN